MEDYKFIEGPVDLNSGDTPTRTVRLSEVFTAADRPLVIYHLMYRKRQAKPCPMCTAWIDGLNGVAHHIAQNGLRRRRKGGYRLRPGAAGLFPCALVVHWDGKIVAAGRAFVAGFKFALARYDSNGDLDGVFGTGDEVITSFGNNSRAFSVAFQQEEKPPPTSQA